MTCFPKFNVLKCSLRIAAIALLSSASGCAYPRLVTSPFDTTGRSLNSPEGDREPEIAGKYVVFVSDRGSSQDIYLYDLVTRQLVDLPGLNAADTIASHPDISADGRYIVFAASREGESDIYLYDRQIRLLKNLTDTLKAEVRNPVISADGNVIAFESSTNGQWDIVIQNRTGATVSLPNYPR